MVGRSRVRAESPSAGVEALAELLRSSERAVVLTGAGISVPSGIPDFRSPGTGLWANVDPMAVAHIEVWREDPDRFWSFYGQRFASLIDTRPNRAHETLAELERRGLIRGVITQNIDRLHRMAGSREVVEVHGSIEFSSCLRCGGRVPLVEVLELLGARKGAPQCESCSLPLKPDVVLFGEMLPVQAIGRAQLLAVEADVMICIGSSLTVYPVAGLPELTIRAGGRLALITAGETPYDPEADVKLDGDVVADLDAVLALLDA